MASCIKSGLVRAPALCFSFYISLQCIICGLVVARSHLQRYIPPTSLSPLILEKNAQISAVVVPHLSAFAREEASKKSQLVRFSRFAFPVVTPVPHSHHTIRSKSKRLQCRLFDKALGHFGGKVGCTEEVRKRTTHPGQPNVSKKDV